MFENITFTDPGMQIISILVGIAVLLLGRKLFWLFVGAVGFVIGLGLAVELLKGQPDWMILAAALIMGFIGALLAMFIQKVAVIIAGFVSCGYALIWLVQLFSLDLDQLLIWLIFIVGGIIGAILVQSLFEVALIVLSSLAGAALITQVTDFNPLVAALLFIGLLVVGIVIQAQMWQEKPST